MLQVDKKEEKNILEHKVGKNNSEEGNQDEENKIIPGNNEVEVDEEQDLYEEENIDEHYEVIDESNLNEIIQENIDFAIEKAFNTQRDFLKDIISKEFSQVIEKIRDENTFLKENSIKIIEEFKKFEDLEQIIEVINSKLKILEEENKFLKEQVELLPAKPEEICNILLTNADNMKYMQREKGLLAKEKGLMEQEIKELAGKLEASQAKQLYLETKLDTLKEELIKKEKNRERGIDDDKKSWWDNFL